MILVVMQWDYLGDCGPQDEEGTSSVRALKREGTVQKNKLVLKIHLIRPWRYINKISCITFEPLPKIDPKDKGKKVLEDEAESDAELEGVDETERKFDQLAKDEEIARKEEKKLADLKNKTLKKYQGSSIKRLNVELKEDTAKVPAEQEVIEQGTKKRKSGHVKMIARKRPRPQPNDDSDDEHRKCLRIVTFNSTIDSGIMETKSFVSMLHKVSSPDGDYLVVYRVNGHFRAFNYLMRVYRFLLAIDLFHLFDFGDEAVLQKEITQEGSELILGET
ncbi:hypothetical protein Tco_0104281 [Tanacetum coccineum]